MRIMPPALLRASALVLVFLGFPLSSATAQTSSTIGERAQGMGGAFVAVADDATAIFWNPAGLGTGSSFDAQVDLSFPGPNRNRAARTSFAGAAMPAFGMAFYQVRSAVSSSGDRKNGGL